MLKRFLSTSSFFPTENNRLIETRDRINELSVEMKKKNETGKLSKEKHKRTERMLFYGCLHVWYLRPGSQALLYLVQVKYAFQPYFHAHSSETIPYRNGFQILIAAFFFVAISYPNLAPQYFLVSSTAQLVILIKPPISSPFKHIDST